MRKTFLYKFLISLALLFILQGKAFCNEGPKAVKLISLAPSITEIVYYLGLDKDLIGISKSCNYPADTKNKEVVSDLYSINKERILELYLENGRRLKILALISAKPFLNELSYLDIIEVNYFEFKNVSDINKAISKFEEMYGVPAPPLKLPPPTTIRPKKILYLIQTNPIITIGKDSYIADVITHSGNISVTAGLKGEYPAVSKEYIASLKPDIVIIDNYGSADKLSELKAFHKGVKFVQLNQAQKDIINRPGPRVVEAVKVFGELAK